MAYPSVRVLGLALFSALSVACGHKIGDECKTSVDCSQGGERLCDVTQPGGYCTVFNCEPDSCPEESACVAFGASLSIAPVCRDPNQLSRFERAFCMLNCSSDSDCRGGYECADISTSEHSFRNALLIDRDRSSKICVVRAVAPKDDENPTMSTEVCTASASSSTGGSSSGGSSGSGGGPGTGGSSGAGGAGGSGSDGAIGGAGGAGSEGGTGGDGG